MSESTVVDPAITAPAKPEPQTFSHEYVKELRAENASYRTRAQEAAAKAEAAEAAAKKAGEEAEAKAVAREQAANDRVIRAELKALAVAAGMVDMDGLKLADLSKVKLNDAGEVEGATELMTALKEAKPYLFKDSTTTSSTQKPPAKKDDAPKSAKEMTKEEYAAEKRKLVGR
jgi:hypothetical protein